METGLQALVRVVISFQEAAIKEPIHGKRAKHSWQYMGRGRESGEKTELTLFWVRRGITKYGTPRLVRPGTLE